MYFLYNKGQEWVFSDKLVKASLVECAELTVCFTIMNLFKNYPLYSVD